MEPLWFHDATITLKNIPADLHRELRKRAEEHHRSLNKEIIATLKSATGGTAIRKRSLSVEEASTIANLAEVMLDRKEFAVSTSAVLYLISRSKCSADDCEFVALADANGVRLLTVDRQILHEFPEVAISLKRFVRD